MADSFSPRTEIDDSQFQGIINVYTTKRVVPLEKPLPNVGDAITAEWGLFTGHVIIARGSSPHGDNHKTMWVMHLHVPASFGEQDEYNFSKSGGDTMSRFYVMKRSDYKDAGYAATIPPAGTPDTDFAAFVFATESVSKIGSDPKSIFVAVERIYMLSPKVRRYHDDELDADVTETTQVVPRGSVDASSGGGTSVESAPGSEHHDLKITSTLDGNYTTPRQLISIPGAANYPFPQLLQGINLVAAYAFANSQEAAPAYDDAYAFAYNIKKPNGGPYETRTLRFLTTDPDALRERYQLERVVTVNESIFITRAKALADNRGNTAFAETSQIDIPETVHGDIEIENGDVINIGQSTNKLAATPNFSAFAASSSMTIDVTPQKTRFGLYLISVTLINTTGIYNGITIPLDQDPPDGYAGDTGANDAPPAVDRPQAPSATLSADNKTVSGSTSAYSEVTVKDGSAIVGRGMSDAAGSFNVPLDVEYTEPTALNVYARRSGSLSFPTPITTFDLAPLAPSATLATNLATLTGSTTPGATLSILVNPVAQVVTATIPLNRPQVLRLELGGTITTDGDGVIDFTSALVTVTGINVPLTIGLSPTAQAAAAKVALEDSLANAHWIFTASGIHVYATARVTAANDLTAEMDLTDPNTTGVNPATSTITTPGNEAVDITTAGNAKAIVTSGLPGVPIRTVPFRVEFGDTPDDVAAKGSVALGFSAVANDYSASSSTNNVSLTALVMALNDPELSIRIENDTCEGLVPSGPSVITTPGVGAVTVLANSSGNYAWNFSPALVPGDVIYVTAKDGGGTSPPAAVVASATPPTLSTASFTDPVTIEGTATIGSKVFAYLGNTAIGNATTDGSGDFEITLATGLIRGESVRVVATDSGNALIRSAALTIEAPTITLAKPVFTETTSGYVGVLPSGADTIAIYPEADPGDVSFATVHPNNNFVFNLPANLGENGERWAVVARYPEGDSDPIWFYAPVVDLGPLTMELTVSAIRPTPIPPSVTPLPLNLVFTHFFWIKAKRPGMVLTLSYPGSNRPDLVIDVDDFVDFSIPGSQQTTWPFSRVASKSRFGAFVPVYDTAVLIPTYMGIPALSGPIPVPLVSATLVVPDGRVYKASFDRGVKTSTRTGWDGTKWTFTYSLPLDLAATTLWKSTYP